MPTILKGEAMCQVGGFKLERHSSQNVKTSVPKFGEQSSTQLVKCSVKLERSLQMRKWRNLYMNLIVHTKLISFFYQSFSKGNCPQLNCLRYCMGSWGGFSLQIKLSNGFWTSPNLKCVANVLKFKTPLELVPHYFTYHSDIRPKAIFSIDNTGEVPVIGQSVGAGVELASSKIPGHFREIQRDPCSWRSEKLIENGDQVISKASVGGWVIGEWKYIIILIKKLH